MRMPLEGRMIEERMMMERMFSIVALVLAISIGFLGP